MGIARSTWIDDDGSGTTGTIINNAELQKIYTNVAAQLDPIQVTATPASGAVLNDWNPGIVGHTHVNLAPTGAISITGFTVTGTPFLGQRIRVALGNSPVVTFYHEDARSQVFARMRLPKPTITVAGFWGYICFEWWTFTPQGMWLCVGHENGHGVALDSGVGV